MSSFYDEFGFHDDPAKRVGWYDQLNQDLKFAFVEELLASFSPNPNIVDLGCGLGDFFAFLTQRGFKGNYLGIDNDPSLLSAAKIKHPNAPFINQSFTEAPFHDAQIAVCIGGLLSTSPPTLEKMLDILGRYPAFVLIGLSTSGSSSVIFEESFVGIPPGEKVVKLSHDEVAIVHQLRCKYSPKERLEKLIFNGEYSKESIARAFFAIGQRDDALEHLEGCRSELADAMRSAWK